MKRHLCILSSAVVTLLIATAAAVSATACLRGLSPKSDPHKNELIIEDLNLYSTASRRLRHRYECYADRASADGNRTAAGLFSALARSERIHENACARAVSLLKGECRQSPVDDFDITDTRGNLRRSLDDERSRFSSRQGSAVRRAIDAGNYYTARILIWIDGTDRRHIELLERCIDLDDRGERCDGSEYHVCPICGNIYEAGNCDAYCPLCRTHCSEFECFGRLQVNKAVADGVNH